MTTFGTFYGTIIVASKKKKATKSIFLHGSEMPSWLTKLFLSQMPGICNPLLIVSSMFDKFDQRV